MDKRLDHPGFRFPGPARMSIYDNTAEMYQQVAMVDNIELRRTIAKIRSKETRDSESVTVAQQVLERGYALSFRFMENLNPDVLKLIQGDGDTSPEVATVANIEELVRLFGTNTKRLTYPGSIVSTLPPPTGAAGTAFGTGGLIAAGDWKFGVVAVYKSGVKTPHSTPSESSSITVAAGEKIAAEWTAPSGITPDHYEIWLYLASGAITDGYYVGSTTALSIVIDNDDGAQDYVAANTNVTTVKSYDGVTTYVANTDYTFDATKGTIKRISTGDIDSGDQVRVSYHVSRAAAMTIDLAPAQGSREFVKVKLTGFNKDDDGKDAGLEIILYKVCPWSDSSNLPFTDEDYFAGSDQEWECMVDLAEDKFGVITTMHGELANFVAGDFEATSILSG